ncbi:hypothetical protein VTL71DRAFT_5122 [Oculimacula yallundae]|uniref:Uncharacterized protein n=1 Tax=Oculimacula yallundae TaxID=86028 RepID=A0ABR4C155_9HELO
MLLELPSSSVGVSSTNEAFSTGSGSPSAVESQSNSLLETLVISSSPSSSAADEVATTIPEAPQTSSVADPITEVLLSSILSVVSSGIAVTSSEISPSSAVSESSLDATSLEISFPSITSNSNVQFPATQTSDSFFASASSALDSSIFLSSSALSSNLTTSPSTINLDISTLKIITLTTFLTSTTPLSFPPTTTEIATLPAAFRTHCAADNCLRAFRRYSGQEFCSLFTYGLSFDSTGGPNFPTFVTQCTGATYERVSSACTCLNNGVSQTPTFTFTGFEPEPTEMSEMSEVGSVETGESSSTVV